MKKYWFYYPFNMVKGNVKIEGSKAQTIPSGNTADLPKLLSSIMFNPNINTEGVFIFRADSVLDANLDGRLLIDRVTSSGDFNSRFVEQEKNVLFEYGDLLVLKLKG